jgi:ribosomal-protein-alanine N-acetyltransferase
VDSSLLTTRRLKIRNLRESDLDAFYQYRSDPEITKYQGFDTFSKEQAFAFISEYKNKRFGVPGNWMQFGIEHISGKKLIGDCAIKLQEQDPGIAEIGITISNLNQKQGYAKEALIGILHFLFYEKGIHRVIETVDAENTASIKLLKSIFFREEAHFQENIFFKGKWGSEYQFVMAKREWDDLAFPNS